MNQTLPLVLALISGCAVGPSRQTFVQSSLDQNKSKPHTLAVKGSLQAITDRLAELAKQRELVLVRQDCPEQGCRLAFRGKPTDRRILRGTTSQTMSYYSRYFVWLRRLDRRRTQIEVIGVPVLGGEMACPSDLRRRIDCKVVSLTHTRDADLVESVRQEWGYDISGANEAEMIQGLLVELRRDITRQPDRVRDRSRQRQTLIVAVFDIEDQSSSVGPAALGQLTEYLAAQLTQLGGFQVVPRDQLRQRLAAEKKKSYRQCYEQRCQIELGKAVAAQKSLATKLIRVGRQCALTALLYDLKTETTDRAASARTRCAEDDLLAGVEKLARQLAER